MAQGIVLIGLGEAAAASFASDPPLVKASKTARASEPIIRSLVWPNLLVAFRDSPRFDTEDEWGQRLCEQLFKVGDPQCSEWSKHPDLKWRGKAIQEGYAQLMKRAAEAAELMQEDRLSLAELAKRLGIDLHEPHSPPQDVIRLAFGPEGLAQYQGMQSAMERDKMLAASYIFGSSWVNAGLAVMSLNLEKSDSAQ